MSLPQPPAADSHDSHHHDEDQSLESLLKLAATESIHRTAFFAHCWMPRFWCWWTGQSRAMKRVRWPLQQAMG